MGKKSYEMQSGMAGPVWYHCEAAVQGRSHVRDGIPCQDKVQYRNRKGVSAIALADGAGSCSQSEIGASVLVQRICDELTEHFDFCWEEDLKAVQDLLIGRIRKTLSVAAAELLCAVEDLSSTLLAAAVSGDRFFALHIGDGVIGCMRDGEAEVLSGPMNGEFKNQTYFTTYLYLEKVMRIYRGHLDGRTGFLLMSDGPSGCLFSEQEGSLSRAVSGIIQFTSTYREDLAQKELERSIRQMILPRTRDDCSLICLASSENWKGLSSMNRSDQKDIFGRCGRDIKTGSRIAEQLSTDQYRSSEWIARKVYVREKRARSLLERMKGRNLVEEEDGNYRLLVHR